MSLVALKQILDDSKKILVVGHTNPDGDAIGAMLGLYGVMKAKGKEVVMATPNHFPAFLGWMDNIDKILIYKDKAKLLDKQIESFDAIFFMDFNQIGRLERMGEVIMCNKRAKKVLVDHHIDPPQDFDLMFSDTSASSTSYLLLKIITEIYGDEVITKSIAESFYVGIMTDTGNFSFSNLSSDLFRAVATLVDKGVNIPYINNAVYNNFSADRMRLMGYALADKMAIIPKHNAAYIWMKEEELRRYNFQIGDTEGFVNMPLSIKGIMMSVMFVQTKEFIRISFRSRGDIDVNIFARKYFNGGGHRNAAGGKSFESMDQTIDHFLRSVEEYL